MDLFESYYHNSVKAIFEKITKITIESDLNRTEEDRFIAKIGRNEAEKLIEKGIKQLSNHLNRLKDPVYTIEVHDIDESSCYISIRYITDKFRKKYIFHATKSSNVKSILENGLLKQDARNKNYINSYDDATIFTIYRGLFFFGAKSLAKKYGELNYGNDYIILKIDNSSGKYNDASYYEPESKEKYGYSHSFFIIDHISKEDISIA